MKTINIGPVELGRNPKTVAIIDGILPIEAVNAMINDGADIFEVRLDCFNNDFTEVLQYIEKLHKDVDTPLIGTLRKTDSNKDNRLEMFKKVIPFIDALDIEIDADINKEVIEYATGTLIIVSEHDYEKTPDYETLEKMVETATKQGAHIVKIATMANNKEDVARLMTFTSQRQEPIVTISMGEIGKLSRLAAPLFGSLFTYTFVNESVAPGQISLKEMVSEIHKYYPEA